MPDLPGFGRKLDLLVCSGFSRLVSGAQVLTPPTATSARPRSILVQSGWTGGRSRSTASPAPSVYRGTQSNDVTTSDFGDYASAYVIEGAAQGVGLKACGQLETMAVSTCSCPADGPVGSVWGTGPYTADSDICTAARHAGVVGPEGGEVTVRRVAGQASYAGGTANGVTTSDWGSFDASFTFGRKD